MWFYIAVMIVFFILGNHRGRSKWKLFFCASVLFIIMGLKSNSIGNDTLNYIYFFERINYLGVWIDSASRFEVGYQIYTRIIGLIFGGYQSLFITTAIICIACITREVKTFSKNYSFSMFLFVSLRLFYFYLSGLRQGIAVSIVFLSFEFLRKQKYIRFILLVLLASTFHYTAIVFLIAIPLNRIKLTSINVIKVSTAIIAIYIFFTPLLNYAMRFLSDYYLHYITSDVFASNNLGNYISLVIKLIFIVFSYLIGYSFSKGKNDERINDLYCKKNSLYMNKQKVKDSDVYMNFMIVAAGVSLFATRASILDRVEQYFWIFSILAIPDMIVNIKDKKKRNISYLTIAVFTTVYNIALLFFRPEWNAIVPYRFFWE